MGTDRPFYESKFYAEWTKDQQRTAAGRRD